MASTTMATRCLRLASFRYAMAIFRPSNAVGADTGPSTQTARIEVKLADSSSLG